MSVPSTRYKTRLFLEKNAKILKNFSTCNRYNCNTFSDRDTKILFQYLKLLFSGQCPMQKKYLAESIQNIKQFLKKCVIFSNKIQIHLSVILHSKNYLKHFIPLFLYLSKILALKVII